MTTEGLYELHWQRREHQQLTLQLYGVDEEGNRWIVDQLEQEPFESDGQLLRSMYRRLLIDLTRSLD